MHTNDIDYVFWYSILVLNLLRNELMDLFKWLNVKSKMIIRDPNYA